MSQLFQIHPVHPQVRLIRHAADILQSDGVIACPTDSLYALVCCMQHKKSLDRIRSIRKLSNKHRFTLMCANLAEIATYAKVNNSVYRFLKAYTPGPYTFLLNATSEVPKRMIHPARRVIGIRVPANKTIQALLQAVGEPLMSVSLRLPGFEEPIIAADWIRQRLEHELDLVIDSGLVQVEPTSIIDLTEDAPQVVRAGLGDLSALQDAHV